MVGIRYPRPLETGGTVAVPAPSSGVPEALHERLDAGVAALVARGLRVEVGDLARRGGLVSGTAAERAAELTAAMTRPDVRAVLPPWGGDLAIDLVDLLDWEALAVDPSWLVGWSDLSTLMLPLTVLTGVATLHGANLMDEPWELPREFTHWTDVAAACEGAVVDQAAAPRRREREWGPWADEPLGRDAAYTAPTRWQALDGAEEVRVEGRLIGGCLETVALLAGSPAGDVDGFARRHAPEGTLVYLEAAQADAVSVARLLRSLRLAGWFRRANGVLVGRTTAPDVAGSTQRDAVERVLGDLGVPVLLDVDAGHVPPQLPLVNGALAEVTLSGGAGRIVQRLVP
ncbi:S66 family peptidase [Frigoribacterium faeni]|uniref:S66 family peptidase n=1 Tax=Frigoribacterium faeni TaxID=145483 RepID=UPI00141B7B6E|nr:S66 peptidase family protein [Frigoribacterium faeni]NIJ05725.1 muramoyltetrapeptide carboxypeptidase LdcA involved in peptidoglycan recycling [Frigoribacterium faeni]